MKIITLQLGDSPNLNPIAISDLHLGDPRDPADDCHIELFKKFLREIRPNPLFFLGDTFELWQFKERTIVNKNRLLLQQIKLSKPLFILGNHDAKIGKWIRDIFGRHSIIRGALRLITDHYIYLLYHGHQHDLWTSRWGAIGYAVSRCAGLLERIISRDIDVWASKICRQGRYMTEKQFNKFLNRAARIGLKEDVDIVAFGHTHKAREERKRRIRLINLGSWTIGGMPMFLDLYSGRLARFEP